MFISQATPLHPRYALGGRVYVRTYIYGCATIFRGLCRARGARNRRVAPVFLARGRNHAAEWIGINGERVYRVSAMLPPGIFLRAFLWLVATELEE